MNSVFVCFSAKVKEPVATRQSNITSIRCIPSADVWMSGLTSLEILHVKKMSSPQVARENKIIATTIIDMLYNLSCPASIILRIAPARINNKNEAKPK